MHAAINFILPQQNLPLVGDQQAPCQYNKIICRGQSQSGTTSRGTQKEVINYKHQGKEKEKLAHHIYS